MQATVENVLKELPAYLGKLTRLLTQPTQLVQAHLDAEDAQRMLEQSIRFLLLSFTIALVLAVIFPEVTHPLQLMANEKSMSAQAMAAIRLLFELLGLAALAYLAARAVGIRSGFQRFFGLMCAASGGVLVVLVFANALTNISMADPVTARAWIQIEQGMASLQPLIEQGALCDTQPERGEIATNPQLAAQVQSKLSALQRTYQRATDRPLFKLASGLQLLALLALLLWSGRVWLSYLKYHQCSTPQQCMATVLLAALSGAGILLYEMVNAGSTMMALYRHCA